MQDNLETSIKPLIDTHLKLAGQNYLNEQNTPLANTIKGTKFPVANTKQKIHRKTNF